MLFDNVEDCCNIAVETLDGVYGWTSEVIAIAIFVIIFNFLTNWVLRRLHTHFQKQNKIWKDSFVRALHYPITYFVWFFAFIQAIDLIAARVYKELPIGIRHEIIAVGALLSFTFFLLCWKRYIVQYMVVKCTNSANGFDAGKIGAVDKLATMAIVFFSLLIFLEVTQRNISTIIAFGGIGGLALAIASQEIIGNFFGGFMIYLTRPFTIGDWILLPDKTIEGNVEEIGWYMTRIRSMDKRPIYIPNAIFSKVIVVTPSRMSHRQIKEIISVRYSDQQKIRAVIHDLKEMLQQHPDIDHAQNIIARLSSFGKFSFDISINVLTTTIGSEEFHKIKEDVLLKILDVLNKHGVALAIPAQEISWHGESLTTLPTSANLSC